VATDGGGQIQVIKGEVAQHLSHELGNALAEMNPIRVSRMLTSLRQLMVVATVSMVDTGIRMPAWTRRCCPRSFQRRSRSGCLPPPGPG
jgi:hypothetical protein